MFQYTQQKSSGKTTEKNGFVPKVEKKRRARLYRDRLVEPWNVRSVMYRKL